MSAALQELLQHPALWRASSTRRAAPRPGTGHPALDARLPAGGWPASGLLELLPARTGIGELQLLLPTLRRATMQCWVNPPHEPYAPALAAGGLDLSGLWLVDATGEESLWALEQSLRAGCFDLVLGWSATRETGRLRRLQLAAEDGGCPCFLFRPAAATEQPSPAVLRLYLDRSPGGLYLRLLKCRGGRPASFVLHETDDAVAGDRPDAPAAGCARRSA